MATIFVVIADIGPYEANEMTLAEDDYVLEELSATAADPAFSRSVLPRTAIGDTEPGQTRGAHLVDGDEKVEPGEDRRESGDKDTERGRDDRPASSARVG